MISKTKYYQLLQRQDEAILSSQMAINWIEVIVFPVPFFIVLFIAGGIVPAAIVTFIVAVLYLVFRYTASVYYKEFCINRSSNEFSVRHLLFGQVRHLELIDEQMQFDKLQFIEMTRGGQTKYLLRYYNHKDHDLLIIRSQKDKEEIESYFKRITGYNTR